MTEAVKRAGAPLTAFILQSMIPDALRLYIISSIGRSGMQIIEQQRYPSIS